MPNIKEILDLMQKTPNEKGIKLISRAYEFAEKTHEGSERKSGEPYFVHVFETAKNLARFGMDAKTISAGLLHDTLEDTNINENELEKQFGKEITFLVMGVTKLGKVKYHGEKRHIESLRKFFLAMAEDTRVIIIKLADRLHNVSTLKYLPPEKQKRIALETIEIHAPLANRLGMGKLKGELEDYAFPYAYPKEYKEMEDILKQRKDTGEKYLKKIHKSILKELVKNNVRVLKTNYRVKNKYSLYKKLLKYDMNIDKVYDVIALRFIVPTIEACYRVLGIIHASWKPLPKRIKDYIASPKPNGYRSLHTTIFTGDDRAVEIQIRTMEMHNEAKYGIAAHFCYKESLKTKEDNKAEWICELKELQKNIADPNTFLENLKVDFFKDRIFIFTPKGDVIDLPEGSTPIDFAYAIHSDLGDHANSVTINNKFSSLYVPLSNNDIVKITTKETSHPTSKWLENAKTTIAKKHIRSYLEKNSLLNKFKFLGKR